MMKAKLRIKSNTLVILSICLKKPKEKNKAIITKESDVKTMDYFSPKTSLKSLNRMKRIQK